MLTAFKLPVTLISLGALLNLTAEWLRWSDLLGALIGIVLASVVVLEPVFATDWTNRLEALLIAAQTRWSWARQTSTPRH